MLDGYGHGGGCITLWGSQSAFRGCGRGGRGGSRGGGRGAPFRGRGAPRGGRDPPRGGRGGFRDRGRF
ncbi:hypothetical protein MKX03_010139 [Papaver bracteatum]|nr:hypothetical protein MKX03_010139 [Papaver bracteatum]